VSEQTCAIIFGGTGFIGTFFAEHLLSSGKYSKVYLFDIEPLQEKTSSFRKKFVASLTGAHFICGDVRNPITWIPKEKVTLIANFAAVHREPGHEDIEYYKTNILGAEHVCDWAERVNCETIIFTSSISPYGPGEQEKDEDTLPVPVTAYGSSKLAAEKIHQIWLAADKSRRHLVIVRPGVVFGPGEGGNVSRLIKAVIGRYFFYMGNKDTRKAGTYVKELCLAITWVLKKQIERREHFSLFNMSMNPGPSIQEYVHTVCKVAEIHRNVVGIPYRVILCASYCIDFIAKPVGIKHPFSPVRIQKLVRSNNIVPKFLIENEYPYKYSQESAFNDWKASCPEEWK